MYAEITCDRIHFMEQVDGNIYEWRMNRRVLMYAASVERGELCVIGTAVLAICFLREMKKVGRWRWRFDLKPRIVALRRAVDWARMHNLGAYFIDYLEHCLNDAEEADRQLRVPKLDRGILHD